MNARATLILAATALLCMPMLASADADFGSATPGTTHCTCVASNGAQHQDPAYEWLGTMVDTESDCYDDNDSDGIMDIYSSMFNGSEPGYCGDLKFHDDLIGHHIGVVEVEICVSDYTSGRYTTDDLYFTGFWDANNDGDFNDAFTWADCHEDPMPSGEALWWIRATPWDSSGENWGTCEAVEGYCFVPDFSDWVSDCQLYRLTFYIPCDQPAGDDSWMRFRLGYGSCPDDPCGTESYGEVEDITGENYGIRTPVELVRFEAEGGPDRIDLSWETAAESDFAGFDLWRAGSLEGDRVRVTDSVIPAQGTPTEGALYGFVDQDVTPGMTYFYWLEAIDINGNSVFHGPESAAPLAEPLLCGVVSNTGAASLVLFAMIVGVVMAAKKATSRKSKYSKPAVRTLSGDRILGKLGPAQTCSPTPAQCPTSD